jgi:hypothetical protein
MKIVPIGSATMATGHSIRQIVAGVTCPLNAVSRPAAGEKRHEGSDGRAWARNIAPI